MPPAHAQFIKELRKPPHIRQFGLQFLYYSKSVCVERAQFLRVKVVVC